MTRQHYIRRTLAALCGHAPATPHIYRLASAMADRAESVCPFDEPIKR